MCAVTAILTCTLSPLCCLFFCRSWLLPCFVLYWPQPSFSIAELRIVALAFFTPTQPALAKTVRRKHTNAEQTVTRNVQAKVKSRGCACPN